MRRAGPAPRTIPQQVLAAAVLGLLGAGLVLLLQPHSPDAAAQVARAHLARVAGEPAVWMRWHSGVSTASYSLLGPFVLATLGVWVTGALAVLGGMLAGAPLMRRARRPRAAAAALSVVLVGNALAGRTTFAIGLVFALACLSALASRRRGSVFAAVLCALVTGSLSPVAALLPALAGAAMVLRWRALAPGARVTGAVVALAAAGPILLGAWVADQPGRMPFPWTSALIPLACCWAVARSGRPRRRDLQTAPARAVLSRGRRRTSALPSPSVVVVAAARVAALLVLLAVFVDSPLGSNAGRLPVLALLPLVAGWSPARGLPWALITGLAVVVSLSSSVGDVLHSRDASATAVFTGPLLEQLRTRTTTADRIEVVDSRTHAPSVTVGAERAIARGWERQSDAARNRLFYRSGLSSEAYGGWLREHAVGWVALPDGPLDPAARAEAALLRAGVPGVEEVWRGGHWRLFRVTGAPPVVTGPGLLTSAITDREVTFTVEAPGELHLSVRWAPRLVLLPAGCLRRAPDGQVLARVSSPGDFRLTSRWPWQRGPRQSCAA